MTVDRSTDTVIVRATMPNPNGRLIDGQLVRVNLESGTPEEKVIIPQSALIADQKGVYVFVVEDGKAVTRRIKTGGENGANVVVDGGPDRGRAGHRGRPAGGASGRGGAGQPGSSCHAGRTDRCSPPCSSTARGWRSSLRS